MTADRCGTCYREFGQSPRSAAPDKDPPPDPGSDSLTVIENATAERIAAFVRTQEDQDGCGETIASAIARGDWRKP